MIEGHAVQPIPGLPKGSLPRSGPGKRFFYETPVPIAYPRFDELLPARITSTQLACRYPGGPHRSRDFRDQPEAAQDRQVRNYPPDDVLKAWPGSRR